VGSHESTTIISLALRQALDKTDAALWDAYSAALCQQAGPHHRGPVFPYYRFRKFAKGEEKTIRVSEQEARFAFVSCAEQANLLYSVETPTRRKHRFVDGNPEGRFRSAMTDITVFESWAGVLGMAALANLEFKAGGFSGERRSLAQIRKDMKKLLDEPGDGIWFHTLHAADNRNINRLVSVLWSQLQAAAQNSGAFRLPKTLTFHICLLRQRFSFEKSFTIEPLGIESLPPLQAPQYKVSRTKLEHVESANGWRICGQGAERR